MPERFAKRLAEDVAFHTDWTWEDATREYGRSRDSLRKALMREEHYGLVARLDENSGTTTRERYLNRVIELIELDSDITWGVLSRVLDRREDTIKQYLYRHKQSELVRRVDQASRKGLR